jgi:hypothetical protein
MGYGGSRKEAGQAIGKSGDGGIDGIIKGSALKPPMKSKKLILIILLRNNRLRKFHAN